MLGILLVSHLAFASQVNCADLRKIANDSIESARLNFKSELNRVDERNIQRRKLAELIILTLNAYVRKTDTDEVYSKIKSTASSAFLTLQVSRSYAIITFREAIKQKREKLIRLSLI